ncbi:MAG TPA: hypothetical protein VMQ62_13090, partial [Dongiaceae bacterium]|nr:hypothetical protein [Dongiaceae bacterium]
MSHQAPRTLTAESVMLPEGHRLRRLPMLGAAATIVGIGLLTVFGAAHPAKVYAAWLVAFLFFLSLALGALYFVLIHYAVQAGWSVVLRRLGENLASTLPVFALLFVPIWLGRHELYEWTRPEEVAKNPILQGKSGFLNEGF